MKADRMTVIVKVAITLDGYLDKAGPGGGLALSSPEESRANSRFRVWADAILVGAETVRRDRPRLLARSDSDREARIESGRPADPHKCVMSRSGDLDLDSPFFTTGTSTKYVLGLSSDSRNRNSDRLAAVDNVKVATESTVHGIAEYLQDQGIRRLLIEGGPDIIGQWLEADLVDEMRVAIAPMIMGCSGHANLGTVDTKPSWGQQRMELTESHVLGDMTVLFIKPRTKLHTPLLPRISKAALSDLASITTDAD